MRWKGNRESNNVEDRRVGGNGLIAGGGIGTIIIGLLCIFLGADPAVVVNQVIQQAPAVSTQPTSETDEKLASFTKVVLAYTEDVWDSIYQTREEIYDAPKLVLITQQTQSGCGFASDASGPFYCPSDQKVYIDLSFFEERSTRFNAPVKLELQANFLAGVWAHHTNQLKNILEPGDPFKGNTFAKSADDEIAAGKYRGPLHGIPYGLKDLFSVKGTKTTWGAAPCKNQVIDENAYVYNQLKEAGAVLVAKFSLGAFAMGDYWFGGRTKNPWNLKTGSSESSAGSASATVAGLVPFAIGTETWGLDKIGPICRSAESAAAFDWPNSFRVSRLVPAVEYVNANRMRYQLQQIIKKQLNGKPLTHLYL